MYVSSYATASAKLVNETGHFRKPPISAHWRIGHFFDTFKHIDIYKMSILIILLIVVLAFITISFLISFVIFVLLRMMLPYFFWGAIYVPTRNDKVKTILRFADIKPGKQIVDLGSGDGRLVIASAKDGAIAYGYEINPLLVKESQNNILAAGLSDKAFIYCKSFWHQNLSDYDVVIIFGMTHLMKRLEKKLNKELKKGTKVISNAFVFPNWKPVKKESDIYLYIV